MKKYYATVIDDRTGEEREDAFLGTGNTPNEVSRAYERQNPRVRVLKITKIEY